MKTARILTPIIGAALIAGCSEAANEPVSVSVPGMPSPELALQRSLDRINGFLGSINERIETPARGAIPLAVTDTRRAQRPLNITPPTSTPSAVPEPAQAQEARPVFGPSAVWFAYGDGYPRIRCAPGSICLVRLQRGETMDGSALTGADLGGWRADLVRGTRGVHAGWAVALTPQAGARPSVLHFATSRRSYALALQPDGDTMRTVAFTYGPSDGTTQPEPPTPTSQSPGKSGPDFTYHIEGPDLPWKPMRVYCDDGHTYFQFPPGGIVSAPRLLVISPALSAAQPYRVIGDSYVVDRRVDQAMLIGAGPGAPVIRITHGGKT
ncbi:TrbG/VirB9 family P-type conjugative transfer protein [Gluconacetobacter sp. 1b LMG 1731]|uniref:TrbG/VirB9 family P-type conjugative transfer protein n=1 Tax=Gluconacetobacter dulcium TaxID=2729096 RepID=A0A7W4IKE7_9PROT|nr:TrbG/VirB9 family P-type conjugative transfer protein [Gluconacetobacter dulcium]MBB2164485.1 TrbG/VirB9 family P-type conjugative transfer protein [Gluconacetobacter dulcium]MBB2193748.1 TrbG/VirB9 family P-type conjugative transfer protein [Gluconacetobacter dulcium]